MFKKFLSLEWKQFSRSSYFKKGIAIKIFLVLGALYFGGCFLILGTAAFFILKDMFPDQDPVVLVNNYLIFWFLADLAIRFFMQQLPVMNIKPHLLLPIRRSKIIHYLLGKSAVSFFNFLSLFFFIPFSIVLLVQGYPTVNVVFWFLSMLFFLFSLNYINFFLNKNNKIFHSLVGILIIFAGLQYLDIFRISEPAGNFFNIIYATPYAVVIPMLLLIGSYSINYVLIRKGFYLDGAISEKVKEAKTTNLSWIDRFGSIAPFLKNDIKLILRNARPKQVMLMSFLFLFYGLIFYTQDIYHEMPTFLTFASMFVTGGFLLSFGQLVPSWDSEYYKLLMSQNIPYRKYLESKWYLMVFGVAISFVLSTPYLYFGGKIFGMIAAGAMFNIGLNSFITLFGGALNRVPVELNVKAKAFGNTQGFNPTQLLIALPKMAGPILIFYIPYKVWTFEAGLIVLALSGILGLVFKNFFLNKIEQVYQKGKYKTIAAFSEKK